METQTGTLIFTTKSGIDVYDCGDYFRFTLPPTDGTTGAEWIVRLEKQGFNLTDSVKDVLLSSDFNPTNGVTTIVAVLKKGLFKDYNRTTKNIRSVASSLKLKTPNAEITCLTREQFTDKEIEVMDLDWIVVMHEIIKIDGYDCPFLLSVHRCGVGRWINAFLLDTPEDMWSCEGSGFAFAISQTNTTQEVL
jgi:hypothetical protein